MLSLFSLFILIILIILIIIFIKSQSKFNVHDISRDACQLFGKQSKCGYDWWWHSLTAINEETGEEKGFFIEYFLCNPAEGGENPVFGQLPSNKAKKVKPSYLMVKGGSWGKDAAQLHRFFGWKNVEVSMNVPYKIKADDCYATEDEIRGHIRVTEEEASEHPEYMCQSGEMSWNLKIEKKVAYNVGFGASKIFRTLQLFEMFWHAEGMKSSFSGEVLWNGQKYKVSPENCYGYSDKNWGQNFTSPWVWLSSNNLTSEVTGKKLNNSVFDIGGGRPKIGFIALPRKLLSAFWYEGQSFEFNFSKFWTFPRTSFNCYETEKQIVWNVVQSTWNSKIVVKITCEKDEMLFVNYEAPTGEKRHNRLWNGGNGKGTIELYKNGKMIDRISAKNIGCEYGVYDD